MAEHKIKLTDDQIDRLTNRVPQLSTDEKHAVRDLLKGLKRKDNYGNIRREKLHEALRGMVRERTISENDMKRIEDACFDQ